jgi:hypothetical protein
MNAKTTSEELHVLLPRELKSVLKSMVGFLNTYFEVLQFIEINYITNKCNQQVICLSFIPFVRRNIQTAVSPTENWTHVYMNLFTRNSPYYHLLKYVLFLLKHPVYTTAKAWRIATSAYSTKLTTRGLVPGTGKNYYHIIRWLSVGSPDAPLGALSPTVKQSVH